MLPWGGGAANTCTPSGSLIVNFCKYRGTSSSLILNFIKKNTQNRLLLEESKYPPHTGYFWGFFGVFFFLGKYNIGKM
jgi:hypothetical protein